jgi:hypothetical protein
MSLSSKQTSTLEKRLNGLIRENLWAPAGDPDWFSLFSAYVAFKTLKDFGLNVDDEEDVKDCFKSYDIKPEDFEQCRNYHV